MFCFCLQVFFCFFSDFRGCLLCDVFCGSFKGPSERVFGPVQDSKTCGVRTRDGRSWAAETVICNVPLWKKKRKRRRLLVFVFFVFGLKSVC